MLRFLFSAFLLLAIGRLSAEAAELYDPNLLHYDPKPVSMPACGFSMALDSTWKFEPKEKTKKDIPNISTISALTRSSIHDRSMRFFSIRKSRAT